MITEAEIRVARTGAKTLGQMSPGELKDALHMAARSMLALSGWTVADDLEAGAEKLEDAISAKVRMRYAGLTVGEVCIALESGVSGEWGRDCRPTAANCLKWLEAYVQTEARKAALLTLSRRRGPRPEDLMTPRMKEELNARARRESCLRAWEDYKAAGRLDTVTNGYAAMVCDHLMRTGLLKPTEEAVRQAYRSSRLRKAQAMRCGSVAEMFRQVGKARDTDGMMDWDCKRELLSMYFAHLRAKGAELRL